MKRISTMSALENQWVGGIFECLNCREKYLMEKGDIVLEEHSGIHIFCPNCSNHTWVLLPLKKWKGDSE